MIAVILAVAAWLQPTGPAGKRTVAPAARNAAAEAWSWDGFSADAARLERFRSCLLDSVRFARANPLVFPSESASGQAGAFEEHRELGRRAWVSSMDCAAGLDRLIARYGLLHRELGKAKPKELPPGDARGAALALAQSACAAQWRWFADWAGASRGPAGDAGFEACWAEGGILAECDGADPALARVFDGPLPELGLAGGVYGDGLARLRDESLHRSLDTGLSAARRAGGAAKASARTAAEVRVRRLAVLAQEDLLALDRRRGEPAVPGGVWLTSSTALSAAPPAFSREAFGKDLAQAEEWMGCLRSSIKAAAAKPKLYPAGAGPGEASAPEPPPEAEAEAKDAWRIVQEEARGPWDTAMACVSGLDGLLGRYGAMRRELSRGPAKDKSGEARRSALALGHAIHAAELRWAYEWSRLSRSRAPDPDYRACRVAARSPAECDGTDQGLAALFNKPMPDLLLSGGVYNSLLSGLRQASVHRSFDASSAALRRADAGLAGRLLDRLREDERVVRRIRGPETVPPAPWLFPAADAAWLARPATSAAAGAEGAPPCAMPGPGEAAGARLKPGDVLVRRRDPLGADPGAAGWWTDAAVFVGTEEERRREFGPWEGKARAAKRLAKSAAVTAWRRAWRGESGPAAQPLPGTEGRPCPAVVVAESGGRAAVLTLREAVGAESLAALRPRVPLAVRERAVRVALDAAGAPPDGTLPGMPEPGPRGPRGAAEGAGLVRLFYAPARGEEALLPAADVFGKPAGSANEIVRRFDREFGLSTAAFEPVFFLDRRETKPVRLRETAPGAMPWEAIDPKELYQWFFDRRRGLSPEREAGADELRESWRRPKWR